jgi:DNA repair exonuclease SbcCD ATPase subunit
MRITRLHLDGFGVLVEEDFGFQPGLNLVFGANEAGKSTLQQALLAMLYGFYQRDRLSAREKQAHAKFRPWVGSQYSGSLQVSLDDGTLYLITRRFDSPEPETQIYNASTGVEATDQFLRKRRGYIDFCERQLGMSRRVFTAVACVRQGQMTFIAEKEANDLSDAIIRLFDSAATDVSVRTVLNRLTTAIRSLGTEKSRSGPWFRAKQAIAEGQEAIEKRKTLTLSLETDYRRANQLKQELQQCMHEKAELQYRVKLIEYTELQHILEIQKEIEARRDKLESQLQGIGDAQFVAPQHRDEVFRLMEERKHIRKRRQELFAGLDSCEKNHKSCQKSLEALPVSDEFWYGDGPDDFLDLKRQWQKHYVRMRESKISQENLQRVFGESGVDEDLATKIQQLDANKVDELRTASSTVFEQQELIEVIEDEIDDRKRYTKWSRIAVSVALLFLLILAAVVQGMPDTNISLFIRQNLPNTLEYLAGGMIALWLAFEAASIFSLKALEDDHRNSEQALRLMQNELKEMLAPYNVKTFEELLNLKLKYVDIRKADEEVSTSLRYMEEVDSKMRQWLQKFGLEEVTPENVNRIEAVIQDGKRQQAQMQKLNDEMAAIDAELAQKDRRLEAVTLQIKSMLEEAECWSDNIEEDAERFIFLADSLRVREAASRELAQITAREQELLKGMSPDEIREQLQQLEGEIGETVIEPDIHTKKTVQSKLAVAEQKAQQLALELATVRERISERENRMPNLSEIEESMAAAQAQIDALKVERQALELAFETLSEVARKAHRDFAPQLASMVGEFLAQITNHRYKELYIDPATFNIRIAHGKAKMLIPAEFLSFGTLEQLYLLIRACVAQLFSTNGEKVPLLLDDPLAHADEKRLSAVLQTIAELAKNQQIFYFTKDQNVIDCLTKDGVEFHLMTLQHADEMRLQTRQASGAAFRTRFGGK